MKTARQLIEEKPGIVSIGPDASVFEALERMAEHDIGGNAATVGRDQRLERRAIGQDAGRDARSIFQDHGFDRGAVAQISCRNAFGGRRISLAGHDRHCRCRRDDCCHRSPHGWHHILLSFLVFDKVTSVNSYPNRVK